MGGGVLRPRRRTRGHPGRHPARCAPPVVGASPGVCHPGSRLPHLGPDVAAEQPPRAGLDPGPGHAVRRRALRPGDGHRHPPGLRERRDAVRAGVLGGTDPDLVAVRLPVPGEGVQFTGSQCAPRRTNDRCWSHAAGKLSGTAVVRRRTDRSRHGGVLRSAARADPLRPLPPHGAVRAVRPHRTR